MKANESVAETTCIDGMERREVLLRRALLDPMTAVELAASATGMARVLTAMRPTRRALNFILAGFTLLEMKD